jgi:integrase/recombinase XerD
VERCAGQPLSDAARDQFPAFASVQHLRGGADIRYIQAMLGPADLKTTQIYTQVSIRQLKQIHTATHPAHLPKDKLAPAGNPPPDATELMAALDAEAEEENEEK